MAEHIEFEGYVQKKNTKGYYQNRYFKTEGTVLKYWNDHHSRDAGTSASAVFDIKDITHIDRLPGRYVVLQFTSSRFLLELRCASEEQCSALIETLHAKQTLYSITELLVELDGGTQFVTKTFKQLMLLTEREQSQWVIGKLDDYFETADERKNSIRRNTPNALINAAHLAIRELIATCEECHLELSQRNPKLSAHCRRYMHTHAEIVKGRIVLELSYLLNTITASKHRILMELGEKTLCTAICLMHDIETKLVAHYSILPHSYVKSLVSALFSVGELISAFLDLSIEHVEGWFNNTLDLSPLQRGPRFASIDNVLLGCLSNVIFKEEYISLQKDLMMKLATNVLLNFSDRFSSLSLDEYEEGALISHIFACQSIAAKMSVDNEFVVEAKIKGEVEIIDSNSSSNSSSKSAISNRSPSPSPQPALVGSAPPVKPRRNSDVSATPTQSATLNRLLSSESESSSAASQQTSLHVAPSSLRLIAIYQLPPAVADAVATACRSSARLASYTAVENAGVQAMDIVSMLFEENVSGKGTGRIIDGWIGGAATKALVKRLDVWLFSFLQSFPPNSQCVYSDVLKMAVCKLVVRLYLTTFVRRYTSDKSNRLSRKGSQQVFEDLGIIATWIKSLDESSDYTSNSNNNVNNVSFELEKQLMQCMQQWLVCKATASVSPSTTNDTVLCCYAKAIQLFGIKYALQIYDLLRLILKMRIDVSSSDRKKVLGQCAEFYRQLQGAVQSDPSLMQAGGLGSIGKASNRKIFEELCPNAGIEHCTGKKWKLENLQTEISPIRILLADLITAVGEAARAARSAAVAATLASNYASSSSSSSKVSFQSSASAVNESVVDGSDSYVFSGRGKNFNSSGHLIVSVNYRESHLDIAAESADQLESISEDENEATSENEEAPEKSDTEVEARTEASRVQTVAELADAQVEETGSEISPSDLVVQPTATASPLTSPALAPSPSPVVETVETVNDTTPESAAPQRRPSVSAPPKPRRSTLRPDNEANSNLEVATIAATSPCPKENSVACGVPANRGPNVASLAPSDGPKFELAAVDSNPFNDDDDDDTDGNVCEPTPIATVDVFVANDRSIPEKIALTTNPFGDEEEDDVDAKDKGPESVVEVSIPEIPVAAINPFDDDEEDEEELKVVKIPSISTIAPPENNSIASVPAKPPKPPTKPPRK